MNSKAIPTCQLRVILAALLCSLAGHAAFGGALVLQGQNKGDTNNWYTGNLQNWQELNYIPCRVYASAAKGGASYTVTVSFPHFSGTTPGFQNLTGFTPSPNAVITDGPTLYAPPSSATWSYTLTFRITDNQAGWVQFLARLAAGSHLNTGSSLMLSGSPSSMGSLQVHKPAAGLGLPDLAIVQDRRGFRPSGRHHHLHA